ncbi:MAG: RNA methyltransferase [Burkholderiales bacterium]
MRRSERRALIEGPHLVQAYIEQRGVPISILVSERGSARDEIARLVTRSELTPVVLSDSLFNAIADSESPTGIAAEIAIPDMAVDLRQSESCLFLDGVQDMGNVGAILRSAAAFGVRDVVLGRGCGDPWAPKTLRAGMGAHFAMRLSQTDQLAVAIEEFGGRVVCTMPHGGTPLFSVDLAGRIGLVVGAEGGGVSDAVAARTDVIATIPMGAGVESINVAAAVAICLYERQRQLRTGASRF